MHFQRLIGVTKVNLRIHLIMSLDNQIMSAESAAPLITMRPMTYCQSLVIRCEGEVMPHQPVSLAR
jgi:hypothetical protein